MAWNWVRFVARCRVGFGPFDGMELGSFRRTGSTVAWSLSFADCLEAAALRLDGSTGRAISRVRRVELLCNVMFRLI